MTSSHPRTSRPTQLEGIETVHVLVTGGAPLVQRGGGVGRAVAALDPAGACRALAALPDADADTTIQGRAVDELADWLCEHGVSEILLHASGEVEIVSLDGGDDFAIDAVTGRANACPLVMVVDAGNRPERDAESGGALLELRRERVRSGEFSALALDAWMLADMDIYVPCHPDLLKREFWPRFQKSTGPNGESSAAFEFFTTIEAAARRAGPGARVMAMGGREALRWAYATPLTLDSVVVDPDSDEPIVMGRQRVLAALFPAVLPFNGVESLPGFDAGQLTSFLPFESDLSLVTGTLLRGWREFMGPNGPTGDDTKPFAFTGNASFIEALASKGHDLKNAITRTETPPFERWLALGCASGGVVLDPTRPAPLVLDPVRLFLLSLWADRDGSLDAESFVDGLARSIASGALTEPWIAAVAAQWPTWVVGESQDRSIATETRPWIATAEGNLALFASEQRLERFVAAEREHGRLRGPWRPRTFVQSVESDLFDLARTEYHGCAIDPAGVDVRLKGARLDRATKALHDLLRPRHMRD
ncbi:hypothetical protein Pla163_12320 [Planctomycetes bacterium Pla163]|uniref:Uncharacterized protein n=1 Tax=Rohdeia mirabilis TaxID=2528008 RepID=A0A518CY32_9BACT|nr:hypothetical protein Pla163_12320 [Planctomycetes bacterium Pla163]